MAIFTNLEATNQGKHGMFESSRIKASITGHLYDLVFDADVDNGVLVKVGDYTGNGLQEREGTVAGVKDKVAITGAPALVKEAFTRGQAEAYNFYNKAGIPVKCYELVPEDIFAIADYQFTSDSKAQVKVGACVVGDGKGAYVASASTDITTKGATNGFVGKIHSITSGSEYTMVRIEVVQNTTIA